MDSYNKSLYDLQNLANSASPMNRQQQPQQPPMPTPTPHQTPTVVDDEWVHEDYGHIQSIQIDDVGNSVAQPQQQSPPPQQQSPPPQQQQITNVTDVIKSYLEKSADEMAHLLDGISDDEESGVLQQVPQQVSPQQQLHTTPPQQQLHTTPQPTTTTTTTTQSELSIIEQILNNVECQQVRYVAPAPAPAQTPVQQQQQQQQQLPQKQSTTVDEQLENNTFLSASEAESDYIQKQVQAIEKMYATLEATTVREVQQPVVPKQQTAAPEQPVDMPATPAPAEMDYLLSLLEQQQQHHTSSQQPPQQPPQQPTQQTPIQHQPPQQIAVEENNTITSSCALSPITTTTTTITTTTSSAPLVVDELDSLLQSLAAEDAKETAAGRQNADVETQAVPIPPQTPTHHGQTSQQQQQQPSWYECKVFPASMVETVDGQPQAFYPPIHPSERHCPSCQCHQHEGEGQRYMIYYQPPNWDQAYYYYYYPTATPPPPQQQQQPQVGQQPFIPQPIPQTHPPAPTLKTHLNNIATSVEGAFNWTQAECTNLFNEDAHRHYQDNLLEVTKTIQTSLKKAAENLQSYVEKAKQVAEDEMAKHRAQYAQHAAPVSTFDHVKKLNGNNEATPTTTATTTATSTTTTTTTTTTSKTPTTTTTTTTTTPPQSTTFQQVKQIRAEQDRVEREETRVVINTPGEEDGVEYYYHQQDVSEDDHLLEEEDDQHAEVVAPQQDVVQEEEKQKDVTPLPQADQASTISIQTPQQEPAQPLAPEQPQIAEQTPPSPPQQQPAQSKEEQIAEVEAMVAKLQKYRTSLEKMHNRAAAHIESLVDSTDPDGLHNLEVEYAKLQECEQIILRTDDWIAKCVAQLADLKK